MILIFKKSDTEMIITLATHAEQPLSAVSNVIHLFWYHDRRCHAVSDLPWVLFHVILWISDRMTSLFPHHPARLPANTQGYHTPISCGSGVRYLLLRSGMSVITALSSSTQISPIQIFISPRPRPGS